MTSEDVLRKVFDRAQVHGVKASSRLRYMTHFQDTLNFLIKHGEQELLDRRAPWDTVQQSAEIEALSAYRAMEHWGTDWGLSHPRLARCYRYGKCSNAA